MHEVTQEVAGQLRQDPAIRLKTPRTAELARRAQSALARRREALLRLVDGNNYALSPEQRHELFGIEAALQRIARGRWGRCEACGHAIGYQLLRAIPDRGLCLGCEPG